VADAAFVYPLPEERDAAELAPLLCAGIIGYRAYSLCGVARRGARLGIYGFGGSAHIAIQVARHFGNEVFVVSRGERHQRLARELGADWVGGPGERPPELLDAAILFAPVGAIVRSARRSIVAACSPSGIRSHDPASIIGAISFRSACCAASPRTRAPTAARCSGSRRRSPFACRSSAIPSSPLLARCAI
jgi:threonine dehydrogenase-like Zn-dependent dehydrogenase